MILLGVNTMAFNLDVKENVLDNGLTVLTVEDHSTPVFTIMLWVPAGSITEEEGKSGLSHFLEHAYSLGSDKLKPREMSTLVQKWGGFKNAFTGKDYTAYYENLPSEHLEKIIELEADRFSTLAVPPEKFESEKLVIMEERRLRTDNSHFGKIFEIMNDRVYGSHPYHKPVIGFMEDIENLTREDILNYYRKHYTPANATFVVTGDIDTGKTLELFRKYFGHLPSGKKIKVSPKAASLKKEYRQVVFKDTEAPFIYIAYPTVDIDNPDIYPLTILATVLSDGSSSRFTQNIRNTKKIVNSANAGFSPQRSTSLFTLSAEGKPGIPILDVEDALYEEIEAVKTSGLTDAEIARALKMTEASFLLGLESTIAKASVIGRYQSLSSEGWRFIENYIPRLREVKSADVVRVAKKYLTSGNRSVITMLPEVSEDRNIPLIEQYEDITRYTYPNGIILLYRPDFKAPGVTIQTGFRAGAAMNAPEKAGLASVTASLLLTGTETMTEEEIAEKLDNIGAVYSVDCGYDSTVLSFTALSGDFSEVFGIMCEAASRPAFEEEKLHRVIDEHISSYRADSAKTASIGNRLFRESVYNGHPYGSLSGGYEETLKNISRDDVLKFHRQHYSPEKMIITVVGNVKAETVMEAVEKRLTSLNSTAAEGEILLSSAKKPDGRKIYLRNKEGQTQAFVIMGYPSIKRDSDDYEAFVIMNRILGGGGFASRLVSNVRTKQGLAYSIYSSVQPMLAEGPFLISFQTKNESLSQALNSIFDEMERMKNETVSEEEFENVRNGFIGSLPFQTETGSQRAGAMLNGQFNNLGMDYLEKRNERIKTLTADDIRNAARKYLNTENIVITVVSAAGEMSDQLAEFGEVMIQDNF